MLRKILLPLDFKQSDYKLLSIQSSLEDYKLAYLLNLYLDLKLHRSVKNLHLNINKQNILFPFFKYFEDDNSNRWFLIQNKFVKKYAIKNFGLFNKNNTSFETSYIYLQIQLRKSDFLFKIKGDLTDDRSLSLLKILNQMKDIASACWIDISKLNHKEYLIF